VAGKSVRVGHVSVQTFSVTHVLSFMVGVQLPLEHVAVTFLAKLDDWG